VSSRTILATFWVLHQFHCDFSLTARQSSFSKSSRTV
jgi:hypothetical protein